MRKSLTGIALATAAAALVTASGTAWAVSGYLTGNSAPSFRLSYPAAVNSRIYVCTICHTSPSGGNRNAYGNAWRSAGRNYAAVEGLDSDNDGATNLEEIQALTFPGDPNDTPAPAGDTTAPTVVTFVIPATSDSLTVPITALAATDDVGVTAYLVKEGAAQPAAGAAGWGAAPASFTFATEGARTLYAFAKDAAGNVSAGASDSVTITLPPTGDTTAPTVVTFTIPETSDSLTVPITALAATDDTGVTAYLVKEGAAQPAAGAAGWSAAQPASYTFAAEGAHTLHAFAKDAAGNVSAGASASVTITLPPVPPPAGEVFSEDFSDADGTGDPDWESVSGRFGKARGAFLALGRVRNLSLVGQHVVGLDPLAGGRIEISVRFPRSARRAAAEVVFDYQDEANYRYARLDRRMKRLVVGQVGNYGGSADGTNLSLRIPALFRRAKRWHRLRLDLDPLAGTVTAYVDGSADPTLTKTFGVVGIGRVGLGALRARRAVAFDDVVVQDVTALP